MKPIEFTFEAVNKRGERHFYGVNMNHALSIGFTDKLTAAQIAFSFIRPLDNELDFSEAIYIGTQSEELRGFFYTLLELGLEDETYRFLLQDKQPFEESWIDDTDTVHRIDLYRDGDDYHYQHLAFKTSIECKVLEHMKYSLYTEAVRHFLGDYDVSLVRNYSHLSPGEGVKQVACRFDNAWELTEPVNEEL